MTMDAEDTAPLTDNERVNSKRKVPFLLLVVMWSLGVIDWSPPKNRGSHDIFPRPLIGNLKLRRRPFFVFSAAFIFTMTFTSYFGAATYFMCFVGLKQHFLRFVIVIVCYWPSFISGTVFTLHALIKNNCRKSRRETKKTSWITLFQESTFLERLSYLENYKMFPVPKPFVFVFFHFCELLFSFVIVIIYIEVYNKCLTWLSYIWIAAQLIVLTHFANFCYFLYLQRIILEDEYEQTETFIEANRGNLEECTEAVTKFFCNYYQLRKLFLLWLSIIFFSITFGIAAYITWSYKKQDVAGFTVLSTQFPLHPQGMKKACPYSCDDPKYLENQSHRLIFTILALGKLFTPAILSFNVTKGLDIKYMWNRLILRLHLMSKTGESDFWNPLIKYTEELHPKTTMDTKLRFIIPVLGLAFGFLGGWKNQT
ncbi:hypothetical protein HOLleu_40592 [Holothuria leucospilota]|uniref:Uncharacterized protein n=1 Tax=Holothuria leucospilota TaxID=206669 RepID=A0A9Q1BDP8_HOLLE|nr:hypothetical protein HOLleu_40592 [Holothuria leucospilota]